MTTKLSPVEHLDEIAGTANGVLSEKYTGKISAGNWIHCPDGFKVSVITGYGTYCTPRPGGFFGTEDDAPDDYTGPFTHVEVGFPSEKPEPWGKWQEFCESPADPTGTVYAYVPVELVRDLLAAHSGAAS